MRNNSQSLEIEMFVYDRTGCQPRDGRVVRAACSPVSSVGADGGGGGEGKEARRGGGGARRSDDETTAVNRERMELR